MRKLLCALTVILVSVNAISVCAAEKAVSSKAEFNPPSDKVLLGKIKTLPENTWMKLPPIKTVGEIGWCDSDYRRQGPRIRDYCNRMVWAPERKRALYCGAGHNIHPYNDVWEYDLAANTWICLYGVEWVFKGLPKNDEDKAVKMLKSRIMLKKGVITTVNGAPVRPAHTWWGLCYDPDKRRLVFWDAHKGLLFTPRKRIAKALGIEAGDPLLRGSGSGPGEAWVLKMDLISSITMLSRMAAPRQIPR